MNFYKHYLGDYARDTAHLSMLEHGAYRLLLDHYYATGNSLPADNTLLHRICRASSKAEKAAVNLIADAFFPVSDDGTRHNNRADREIEQWTAQAQANRETGKRGGRPRKTDSVINSETESVIRPEPNRNPNHSHSHKNLPDGNTVAAQPLPDVQPDAPLLDSTQHKAVELAVEARKLGVDVTAMHPIAQEWAKDGVTVLQITEAVGKARLSKPKGNIPANYLAQVLEDVRNPKAKADQWWTTDAGVDRKGREVGVQARPHESYSEFKQRIFEELGRKMREEAA